MVFDHDYPKHPTVFWGVIGWKSILAIYSIKQLSHEVNTSVYEMQLIVKISFHKYLCSLDLLPLILNPVSIFSTLAGKVWVNLAARST